MEFNFIVSPAIFFGMNKTNELGELLKGLGRKKVMIVCDESMVSLGFVKKITDILDTASLDSVIFDKVMPNPTDELVHEGASVALDNDVDSFVGIGGGSVMDSAKAINILMSNGGVISDYEGINKVSKPVLPSILLPTTSGTASELTSVSVITDTTNHKKMVIAGQFVGANIAICDPSLTKTLPKSITAATGMDALTHAIEAYISKAASPVTDPLALQAIEVIMKNLETAVHEQTNEARSQMMLGSALAGMAFNSALLGLVHSLAHPLSAHFNTPHGVANAIFLPYIIDYNMDAIGEKTNTLAQAMGIDIEGKDNEALGKLIVKRLHDLSSAIDIPTLSSLDIPSEKIPTLASDALNELSTLTNPKEATKEILVDIIKEALSK